MTAGVGGPRKYNGLTLAKSFLEHPKDEFVVYHSINIVQAHRIRSVVIDDISMRDALSEIGLYAVTREY